MHDIPAAWAVHVRYQSRRHLPPHPSAFRRSLQHAPAPATLLPPPRRVRSLTPGRGREPWPGQPPARRPRYRLGAAHSGDLAPTSGTWPPARCRNSQKEERRPSQKAAAPPPTTALLALARPVILFSTL